MAVFQPNYCTPAIMTQGAVGGKTAVAFVGHVHIERNLFMSLDRTSASCDLCALESIQDLNYNGLME